MDLLQVARNRFIRLGYDATTLRDVAAEVGVNPALITRYFGSKEGLFKATIEATPRFLNSDNGFPTEIAGIADALSRHLAADAWPEFDDHPVLMLLHASGDSDVDQLRRKSLQDISRRLLEAAGPPDDVDRDQYLLRAELVVALGIGIAVARSAVGLEPLSTATSEELINPLRDVIEALLAPRSHH
nr:TetR/AcrR family transcriptional regulator [Nocardia sp. XZ_19_231]